MFARAAEDWNECRPTWLPVKTAFNAWNDDYAQTMDAALSYYTVFLIAAGLLMVMSIAGLGFGQDAAHGEIAEQLADLLRPAGCVGFVDPA